MFWELVLQSVGQRIKVINFLFCNIYSFEILFCNIVRTMNGTFITRYINFLWMPFYSLTQFTPSILNWCAWFYIFQVFRCIITDSLFSHFLRFLCIITYCLDWLWFGMQKWSKGKQKEKVNNMVLFDQATYDKLLSEAPKYKLITPSILSDRLRVCYLSFLLWLRNSYNKNIRCWVNEEKDKENGFWNDTLRVLCPSINFIAIISGFSCALVKLFIGPSKQNNFF